MKYLAIYRPETISSGPPSPEHMAEMGKYVEESRKNGSLIETGALAKGSARARLSNAKFTVATPPDTASGYAILRADSQEELQTALKKFLSLAGDGECEVHPIMEFGRQ